MSNSNRDQLELEQRILSVISQILGAKPSSVGSQNFWFFQVPDARKVVTELNYRFRKSFPDSADLCTSVMPGDVDEIYLGFSKSKHILKHGEALVDFLEAHQKLIRVSGGLDRLTKDDLSPVQRKIAEVFKLKNGDIAKIGEGTQWVYFPIENSGGVATELNVLFREKSSIESQLCVGTNVRTNEENIEFNQLGFNMWLMDSKKGEVMDFLSRFTSQIRVIAGIELSLLEPVYKKLSEILGLEYPARKEGREWVYFYNVPNSTQVAQRLRELFAVEFGELANNGDFCSAPGGKRNKLGLNKSILESVDPVKLVEFLDRNAQVIKSASPLEKKESWTDNLKGITPQRANKYRDN